MSPNPPALTIGFPVYNGEKFIRRALDSLLSQTFTDYEIIISDNASTDGTAEICQEYADKYPSLIRFDRLPRNLGAAPNFNRVVEMAQPTRYFKWMAHDDICEPEFLEKCIDQLERHPSAVLSFPQTIEIREDGSFGRQPEINWDWGNDSPYQRFRSYLRGKHRAFEIFGVIRHDVLRQTGLIGSYSGADIVLIGELLLHGPFIQVPEPLFLRMMHPGLFQGGELPPRHLRMEWFDTANANKITMPVWRRLREMTRTVCCSPLSPRERAACMLELGIWVRYHWRTLLQDIRIVRDQKRLAASAVQAQVPPPVGEPGPSSLQAK